MNNTSSQDAYSYERLALEKGDTNAYSSLQGFYMDAPKERLLYPALIMANKYNYPPAYYDVYVSLTDLEHKTEFFELNDLDDKTKRLALDYLISGANNGDRECKWVLGHHYMVGIYIEKDTVKGRRLMNETGR